MNNHGIDLTKERFEQSELDWKFGATSLQCLAQIPVGERMLYLPKGEVQKGREDFMDCATRGVLNILETKLNYLWDKNHLPNAGWFLDNGYRTKNGFELSDRFNAILSKTSRQGNSLKAPLESVRKDGVIPKSMLPANSSMTWDDYHKRTDITDKMTSLGQECLKYLSFNYEKVFENQFDVFDDLLDVAGFAWPEPTRGEYPRFEGEPNHVWVNIAPKYYAFDNYIDSVDGDFIKKLSPYYDFYEYGYRLIITRTIKEQYVSILSKLVEILKSYVSILSKGLGLSK